MAQDMQDEGVADEQICRELPPLALRRRVMQTCRDLRGCRGSCVHARGAAADQRTRGLTAKHDSGGLNQSGDDGLRAVALCIPTVATRELI